MNILRDPNAVTVMVPTYNVVQYIEASLRSLQYQTMQKIRVLICDDYSSDGTFEVAREFVKKDNRFTVSRPFSENRGASALLNYMLEQAETKFVARHDADDVSDNRRIERQFAFMQKHENAVLTGTRARSIRDKSIIDARWEEEFINPVASDTTPINEHLATGPRIMGGTMFAKADVLLENGGFNAETFPLEDWDTSLELAKIGDVFVLEQILYMRRLHERNSSGNNDKRDVAYQALRKRHPHVAADIDHSKICQN